MTHESLKRTFAIKTGGLHMIVNTICMEEFMGDKIIFLCLFGRSTRRGVDGVNVVPLPIYLKESEKNTESKNYNGCL